MGQENLHGEGGGGTPPPAKIAAPTKPRAPTRLAAPTGPRAPRRARRSGR
jgi:hypothetical protein